VDNFDKLPCAVLVTRLSGHVLRANREFTEMIGRDVEDWPSFDSVLSPASRIFAQTHVWPLMLREGSIREVFLHVRGGSGNALPVLVSGRKDVVNGAECYLWVFYAAPERTRFEAALLEARRQAEAAAAALAERERFVATITDGMPGLVGYWDKDLRCRFANVTYQQWFGIAPRDAIGMSMVEMLGERVARLDAPHVAAALGGTPVQFERNLLRADGTTACSLAHYIPNRDSTGQVVGFFVLVTDVTALKEAEAELRLAASIVEHATEGIIVTDGEGTILSVNPAFTRLTGYTAEEAVGQTPRMLRSDHHDGSFFAAMRKDLETEGRWHGEKWHRRKGGEAFLAWEEVSRFGSTDMPVRYLHQVRDITERWRDTERMRHLAMHDALTGLPNRTAITERLGLLLQQQQREDRKVALFFLDLDRFKAINDSQGHAAGDLVLQTVAKRLQSVIRGSDTAARLGGDEFVVLLDNPLNREEVARIAQRIIASVGMPIIVDGTPLQVGVSIGVAMRSTAEEGGPAELMKHADAAMYSAKQGGRNAYHFFEASPVEPVEPSTSGLRARCEPGLASI
jgi:diguanylate cyclase (GGDEF)-like protein/PAS domain S-box-containing protein